MVVMVAIEGVVITHPAGKAGMAETTAIAEMETIAVTTMEQETVAEVGTTQVVVVEEHNLLNLVRGSVFN